MAKTENQKMKLLLIARYLYESTDEDHCVGTSDIIAMLDKNNVEAERKSIYADINVLINYGMDIEIVRGRSGGFKLVSRRFELTELKLLVDAVQCSKFITAKKSKELIKKIESLASVYEHSELQRSVFIANRIKNENESIYYNTDMVFKAISKMKQVSFKYFNYGVDKKQHFHNNNDYIFVSPYGLQYDNEKYYMIAYDSKTGIIKHYRVDRMTDVTITDKDREGSYIYKAFDVASYASTTEKMFTGEVVSVTLKFRDDLAGAIIDKFGKKNIFYLDEEGYHTVSVRAALSPTFYSWVFTFSGGVSIVSPEKAVEEYREQIENTLKSMNSD